MTELPDDDAFPDDAIPGEVHRGPDNRWYQLEWSGKWRLHPRDPALDHDPELPPEDEDEPAPEPHFEETYPLPRRVIEAGERIAAREREEAMAAAAERRRALAREEEGEGARRRLAAARYDPDLDDRQVDLHGNDYADVIAEVAPDQRRDGWTAERRILFLDRLAEHGSIRAACSAADVSRQSAYALAARAPAFAAAFTRALRLAAGVLADTLMDRAIHGTERPVFHKGTIVGTRTVHHDRLGCYLLRACDPASYAPVDDLEPWKARRTLGPAAPTQDPAASPPEG